MIEKISEFKKSGQTGGEEISFREKIQLKIVEFVNKKKLLFETDRQLLSTSIVVPTFLGLPLKFSLNGILSGKFDLKMNLATPPAEFDGKEVESKAFTFEIKPRFPYCNYVRIQ